MGEDRYIVYLHVNKLNKKIYVGITKYSDPSKRWKYGYKGNPHFNGAIQKYGWDNFEHIILFRNLSKEVCCRLEQLLISRYRKQNRCYNIANGGEGASAMSEETKNKLRSYIGPKSSQYGKKHSPERVEEQRRIAKECWIKQREHRLKELLKYGFKSGKNHPYYGKPLPEEVRNKVRLALSKPVLMLDKNTNEVIREFTSATEAERFLNAKGHHINCCCAGKRKTAYGYIWKYKEGR